MQRDSAGFVRMNTSEARMNQPQLDFTRYPERASFKAVGESQDAANATEGAGRAARVRTAGRAH